MNNIFLGSLIVIIFTWRFYVVRKLYLTSLKGQGDRFKFTLLKPFNPHQFIQQIFLGHRNVSSASFFIRGFVLAIVTLCLYPFKAYNPYLYLQIITIVLLYIPWCVVHGFMLKFKKYEK